jgi:hypothetical protein
LRKFTSLRGLSELGDHFADKFTLHVRPRRRTYLSISDAVYDYKVGHELVVSDDSSPLNHAVISVLDAPTLKERYSIHTLSFHFNPGMAPTEIKL